MNIIVLGGDGFCGWPISLNLSNSGHNVKIVDNLSRRKIDRDLKTNSLTKINTIKTRIDRWRSLTHKKLDFININIAKNYKKLLDLLKEFKPDVIIHLAEQRAAPYSMKNAKCKIYTVNNNINSTHNLLCSVVESGINTHIIHMGTMGVYGYGYGGIIPEGYVDVIMHGEHKKILHPTDPGSVYHMTKSMDELLFYFYCKNNKLKITDLHQGIVWGTQTAETKIDNVLINRFDYDGDYGTVLNRFLMQAAIGYPLTIHGTGEQTRAFININDSIKCINIAINNPPDKDQVSIFNQATETYKLLDLAEMIKNIFKCKIDFVSNPRIESPKNNLNMVKPKFFDMGLNPIKINNDTIMREISLINKFKRRCAWDKIPCTSTWS